MKKLAISVVVLLSFVTQMQGAFSDKLRANEMCSPGSIQDPEDKNISACYQKCEETGREPRGGWSCAGGPFEDCPSNCYCFCEEKPKSKSK